tara:strand:+ start:441 stop:662 length:222 start_codon:yes stop_codon:yes gene_type:complete
MTVRLFIQETWLDAAATRKMGAWKVSSRSRSQLEPWPQVIAYRVNKNGHADEHFMALSHPSIPVVTFGLRWDG